MVYHFSIAAFDGWTDYEKISGGNWRPNNGHHSAPHNFVVDIKDQEHPITKGLKLPLPAGERRAVRQSALAADRFVSTCLRPRTTTTRSTPRAAPTARAPQPLNGRQHRRADAVDHPVRTGARVRDRARPRCRAGADADLCDHVRARLRVGRHGQGDAADPAGARGAGDEGRALRRRPPAGYASSSRARHPQRAAGDAGWRTGADQRTCRGGRGLASGSHRA